MRYPHLMPCNCKIQPATLNYSILNGSPIAPLPPHIQPSYYAAIIAAEAIGSTGTTQVVEIPVNATDVSGYAVFEHGHLTRAVFVNLLAYLPGGGVRSTTHINIDLSGQGRAAQQMEVKRLDITYGGSCSVYPVLISSQICKCDLRGHLGRANV